MGFSQKTLDIAYTLCYNIRMKQINSYDSSFSPNEMGEASDIPNCGACYDDGMIDGQIYCECPEGDKRMNKECDIVADICDGSDPYYDNF